MCRKDLMGHSHSLETEDDRVMEWELGTLLGCHSVMLGFRIFCAVLVLFSWSYLQRNPGRIIW